MALIREGGPVDVVAWLITTIAAINWGVQEILGSGLFVELGLSGDALTSVYIGVGVIGVINLVSFYESYVGELA